MSSWRQWLFDRAATALRGGARTDTFPSMTAMLSSVGQNNYEFEISASKNSSIKLFAPHGGCIEPGTAPVVRELASDRYDYYIFRGLLRGGGCRKLLHVKSTHYDEERCQSMARSALFSLSVHGCRGKESRIEIGGGNEKLATHLFNSIQSAYPVALAPAERDGRNPLNFINQSRCQGVQLELSEGFRQSLFLGYPRSMRGNPRTFPEFIHTLRDWLRTIEATFVS